MSIESHFIHRCTIERPAYQPNPYGEDAESGTTVVATGTRCRLVISSERIEDSTEAERPRISRYKHLLPAGTDVRKGDRITTLTLEDGTVLDEKFSVEAILPRRAHALHHVTCELKRIS